MELHFCSQCGISIPLAEVQSGAATAGEGRYLCGEHRPAKPAAPAARTEDVELLFCANCQVSIPAGDVDSARARREFGSMFCAACSVADTAERDRRRKSVEADLAAESPAGSPASSEGTGPRTCTVCSVAVPADAITSGRALVDGSRVVCPRCREAGTSVPPRTASHPASAPASSGAATWVLGGLLVIASLAAGFFGTEYVRARRVPPGPPPASAKDLADVRTSLAKSIEDVRSAAIEQADARKKADKEALDDFKSKATEDLVGLREDLSDVRTRLMATDGDLAQRIAKLEGQIGGLQEMLKGLAARPSGETPRTPVVQEPRPDERPPEGPPPDAPPVPGQVAPDVARLIKDLLESTDEGARFAAANELTRRKERAAITAFAKQVVDDPNLIVRRSCARGLGETRAWNAVPYLILAIEDKQAFVAQQANFALQSITGQDFGVTIDTSARDRKVRATTASKWWEKNKDTPPDGVCTDPVNLEKK